jgi:hypothetical protein
MTSDRLRSFLFSKTGSITLFGVILLVFVLTPFVRGIDGLPYWFHDHFFNAVQIAENVRTLGFPTMDSLTPTNDFSPVWTLLLVLFSALTPVQSPLFFGLVLLALAGSAVLSLYLLNRLIHILDLPSSPAAVFFTNALFLAMFMRLAITGTDTVWAVPAVFAMALALFRMLRQPSFATGLTCGLSVLIAAAVRFDALGFVLTGAFVFYMQFNGKTPVTLKEVFRFLPGFMLGLLPAAAVLVLGYFTFETPLPSSLQSWMKVQNIAPWNILTVLFWQPLRYFFRMPTAFALTTIPALTILTAAYATLPRTPHVQTPKDTVFYTLIWFPIIQLGLFAFFTYMQLPEYAFYPLCIGTPFALLYILDKIDGRLESDAERRQANIFWNILGGLMLLLSLLVVSRPRIEAYRPVAETVREFARTHPGIYAMGSGAGVSAYLSGMPFVRLDGLAGDHRIQDYLGQQAALSRPFLHYGVDYYVAVNLPKGHECYVAREPKENTLGGNNKGMSDWMCAVPVLSRAASPKINVMIFAIGPEGKAVNKD